MSADQLCHACKYDLRAHPQDGNCPECGVPVAESRRLAAIPLRPAWRDSDPRWRRRMLAGAWILVLMPLMNVVSACGWAPSIPVPAVFEIRGSVRTLNDTFLCNMGAYELLIFCLGSSVTTPADVAPYRLFFCSELLCKPLADPPTAWIWNIPGPAGSVSRAFLVEVTKWCIMLTISVWLSIAQLAARRQRKKAGTL